MFIDFFWLRRGGRLSFTTILEISIPNVIKGIMEYRNDDLQIRNYTCFFDWWFINIPIINIPIFLNKHWGAFKVMKFHCNTLVCSLMSAISFTSNHNSKVEQKNNISSVVLLLVACTRLYTPLCLSVHLSIGRSNFTFFMIFIFGPYCSSPNGLVISNMAPAHPHATWIAVYPALLFFFFFFKFF